MRNATAAKGGATQANPSPATAAAIRTGNIAMGERTAFRGRVWRSRGVILNATTLTIHQPSKHVYLPLSSITQLERTDLMPHSLSVKCAGKTYHLSFDSDSDLYDWQDDIYSRCPLGAQTTNPFNFQHTAHIGSNGATGVFSEPTTLPMYEEMIGRSPAAAQAITPAAAAAASLARPAQTGSARRRSNPLKGTIILNNDNNINIEGVFFVRQTGMFLGWYWKERWLSLKGTSLTVHTRKTKASPPAKEIFLSTIKSVEPDPKRSNCLFIATTRRETCLSIIFPSDGDMYAWREAMYLRSGLSSDIGSPTNVVHKMHVSYDKDTGELKGLPDHWKNDPSLAMPLVAKISMQTGNNANNGRSARRRSQPAARAGNETLDLSPAMATAITAKSAPSPVGKSPSSTKSTSSPMSSAPLFANLSQVPPPTVSGGVESSSSPTGPGPSPVGSPTSQFMGASLDSQGTLLGTPASVSSAKAPLGMVRELQTTSLPET